MGKSRIVLQVQNRLKMHEITNCCAPWISLLASSRCLCQSVLFQIENSKTYYFQCTTQERRLPTIFTSRHKNEQKFLSRRTLIFFLHPLVSYEMLANFRLAAFDPPIWDQPKRTKTAIPKSVTVMPLYNSCWLMLLIIPLMMMTSSNPVYLKSDGC